MGAREDIIIIGAGEAAVRTALKLREKGYEGTVTLVGDELHLPYERPPLSKDMLTAEADLPARTIADAGALEAAGIATRLGTRAVSIDRDAKQIKLADGTSMPYGKLLLATGASSRRLPMAEGSGHRLYLRSHDDALAIRRKLEAGSHVVIVGGGFIGLEIAASARKRGCAVTVVEAQPRLLMRGVPAAIAEVIQNEHLAQGVRVLTGTGLAGMQDRGDGVDVTLSTGEVLEASLCVIGIGAVPNTELAEQAGLVIDNGIAVDNRLRTSDLDIYAIGDCASFPVALYGNRRVRLESWRNTHDHAEIAATNLAGGEAIIDAVPWFWSDQYDLGLQVAGLIDEGTRKIRRDIGDGAFLLFCLDSEGRLVAASGIGPGNSVARDIRLAEMLIAKRARPDVEALADPDVKLKSLLK